MNLLPANAFVFTRLDYFLSLLTTSTRKELIKYDDVIRLIIKPTTAPQLLI